MGAPMPLRTRAEGAMGVPMLLRTHAGGAMGAPMLLRTHAEGAMGGTPMLLRTDAATATCCRQTRFGIARRRDHPLAGHAAAKSGCWVSRSALIGVAADRLG
jgi:hypothetical protein